MMDERVQDGATSAPRLRITLVKSPIGYRESQRRTVKSLGLRRLHQSVDHDDTPTIRGMVGKVAHLVQVEEAPAGASAPRRQTGTQRFVARQQAKEAAYQALVAELLAEADQDETPASE